MGDFDLALNGVRAAIDRLEEVEDDIETVGSFIVGTGVEYSVYLEFGTSKMDAKPFFRPALNEVRAQGVDGFIRHNTRTSVSAQDDASDVLRILALALERRVKEIITRKGLIDTGTLRASIVALRGVEPDALPTAADFSGFDSENQAPRTAGRAVAENTVEI